MGKFKDEDVTNPGPSAVEESKDNLNKASGLKKANPLEMFTSFFKIGAFTFGGGYAMIPIMEREFIDEKKWVSKEEFIDLVSLSQGFPGVLAANISSFIGNKLFGIPGAMLAVSGVSLPSIIIILIIAAFFAQFRHNFYVNLAMSGVNAAVPALILIALVSLSKNMDKTAYNIILMIASTIALIVFDIHPLIIIIAAATLGIIKYRGGQKNE